MIKLFKKYIDKIDFASTIKFNVKFKIYLHNCTSLLLLMTTIVFYINII